MKPTERDVAVFGTSRMTVVASAQESLALVASTTPAIVIAASGMATGGRVLNHLVAALPNPNNTVSLSIPIGRHPRTATAGGRKHVKIQGQLVPVAAHIEQLDWMSAHADARDHAVAVRVRASSVDHVSGPWGAGRARCVARAHRGRAPLAGARREILEKVELPWKALHHGGLRDTEEVVSGR
jgi:Cft2 family RNA processing exonuclease